MNPLDMTIDQRNYIEALRTRQNISLEVLNRLCIDRFRRPHDELNKRQASGLIDLLKSGSLQRELQLLAGQQPLI